MILSPGLNVCTAHVLMRFCHLNRSLVCLQSEIRTSYENEFLYLLDADMIEELTELLTEKYYKLNLSMI